MALPQGIAFRNTLGYVTDAANYDAQTSATADFPRTSAQGNTVGLLDSIGFTANRDTGVDPRLAGVAVSFGSGYRFQITTPSAANYRIGLAGGDATTGGGDSSVNMYDNTSNLGSLCNRTSMAAGDFADSTNTVYTAANWPSSQALSTFTFSTTAAIWQVNGTGSADKISSLYIEAVGGGGGGKPALYYDMQRRQAA